MNERRARAGWYMAVAVAVLAIVCAPQVAEAGPITGTIAFGGDGTPIGSATWYGATGVTFINPWGVTQRSGDYIALPLFTPATFTDISWGSGSGTVNVPLSQTVWEIVLGTDTYKLTVGTVDNIDRGGANNDNISVIGSGTLSITGFDDTPGVWSYTAGVVGAAENLSFSASPLPTPEPATLVMLGTGLLGLVVSLRRRNR
jgi:hypothetical protein